MNRSVEQYLPENGVMELHDIYCMYPEWQLKTMRETELAAIRTEFRCSLYEAEANLLCAFLCIQVSIFHT